MKVEIKELIRICPICNGDHGRILHTQQFQIPVEYQLPSSYDVISCTRCGFVFADSSARQENYDHYYEYLSKYGDKTVGTGGGLTDWDKSRLDEVAKAIATFLPRKAKILDMGCANGGMLLSLKKQGFDNLVGIDPSERCVKNCQEQGFEAYQSNIFSTDLLAFSEEFDCIILSHVLEHIYDLNGAVQQLDSLLKRDGCIYVEVPDASRYKDFYVIPNYYFDCEHINHFSIGSLNNLFFKEGFQNIYSSRKVLHPNHIPYPAVYCIYKKALQSNNNIVPEFDVIDSIEQYLKISRESNYKDLIHQFYESKEPLVVWGAGSYTLRLLGETQLSKCNILFFVDKDENKQGKEINGIQIYSPEFLVKENYSGTILICTALYSKDIERELSGYDFEGESYIIR